MTFDPSTLALNAPKKLPEEPVDGYTVAFLRERGYPATHIVLRRAVYTFPERMGAGTDGWCGVWTLTDNVIWPVDNDAHQQGCTFQGWPRTHWYPPSPNTDFIDLLSNLAERAQHQADKAHRRALSAQAKADEAQTLADDMLKSLKGPTTGTAS